MKLKHWVVFIILNIVISAVTALAMLMYWERTHPPRVDSSDKVAVKASVTPKSSPAASSVVPLPTLPPPTFTPAPLMTYVVQRGDTLSAISRRFNVPLQDLMAANNLSVDAVLHVGQQVVIPASGQPVLTPTPSTTPTPPSPELVPHAGAVSVEIRQIIARGDPTREAVVIANLGRQVNLRDWKLADANGDVYTFPDLTLWPGGTVTVHTGSGPDSVSDLYWKRIAPVWAEPGDVATLSDAGGSEVARYQLP